MPHQSILAAVSRVKAAFERRPEAGIHDDAPASAHWIAGTRIVTRHANDVEVVTDMPLELGGSGDQVTPGWLFRAGVASCAATSITLAAACEGVDLASLFVNVRSRSDARGLLGMSDIDTKPVHAGPFDVQLQVTLVANGSTPAALKAMVEKCLAHSPVPCALTTATPFTLHINAESR